MLYGALTFFLEREPSKSRWRSRSDEGEVIPELGEGGKDRHHRVVDLIDRRRRCAVEAR